MNARLAHRGPLARYRAMVLGIGLALVAIYVTPPASAAENPAIDVSAPSRVAYGGTVSMTLSTGDGFNGTADVYYRKDDVWIKSAKTFTVTNGQGAAAWTTHSSCQYYVKLSNGDTSPVFTVLSEDKNRYSVSAKFSASSAATGEMVWIKGTAYLKGKARAGAKVVFEYKKNGTTKWKTYHTSTASATGGYSFRVLPSPSYAYRIRVSGTSAASGPLVIKRVSEDRTLEFRAEQLASALGAPQSSIKTVADADLPSGVTAARYQTFAEGQLFEVNRSGTVRTWIVYSRIYDKFASLDGHTGDLGLPMNDPRCSLLENGCVQRFTGGSLYVNSSKMSPHVYVAYGTYVETEMFAAAWSQIGYEEPSWRDNKYTDWLGSNPAWCMTFTAWAATAAGHPGWVPKSGTYTSYVSTLKKSGRLHYSGTPPKGAALLLDWNLGTPVHSAMLSSISGKYIYTLEGNTTDGTGDPQRGVYHRKRELTDIWAWYIPSQP